MFKTDALTTVKCRAPHDSGTIRLTFWGLTGTLSKFMFMPGMITVILRGPLNPSTLVSCQMGQKAWQFHLISWMNRGRSTQLCVSLSFTHVADGSQFLSCVALFQQRPGVFAGIGAVVVHCEFGAHEVGPDRIYIGDEMFTPFHICQLLAEFFSHVEWQKQKHCAWKNFAINNWQWQCSPPWTQAGLRVSVVLPQFTYEALSLSRQISGIHWNKVVGSLTLLSFPSCQQKHLKRQKKRQMYLCLYCT